MDAWILRPSWGKEPRPELLQVAVLQTDADGNETEVEKLTLRRRKAHDPWEREGLFEELVQDQIEQQRRHLILDLAALDKVDSSGIGDIVAAFQRTTNSGGELVLANLGPKISDIFHRTELDKRIRVFDSVADALASDC